MATQQDIAREAGVSPTTVSFVLNGRAAEMKIGAACERRVMRAAERLGYCGNHHAQALATGRSMTLGFASPGRILADGLFGMQISLGVQSRARELGYDVLVFGPGDEHSQLAHALNELRRKRVDALLLPHFPGRGVKTPAPTKWPIVMVQAEAGHGYPCARLDPAPGLRQAAAHLAELGHEHVAWVGGRGPRYRHGVDRLAIFSAAAAELGVVVDETQVGHLAEDAGPEMVASVACWQSALDELRFPRTCTAAMCYNDAAALALQGVLAKQGVRVPRDFSVVGFDDLLAEYGMPALTTVSHMLPQIGAAAVDMALDLIENERAFPYERETTVAARLVVRDSTGSVQRTRSAEQEIP